MKTGLDLKSSDIDQLEVIKDDEGRVLLSKNDLEHKHHVDVNDLVPKTISNQLDKKVGNWKTTYDIINEAPFRNEPISNYIKFLQNRKCLSGYFRANLKLYIKFFFNLIFKKNVYMEYRRFVTT